MFGSKCLKCRDLTISIGKPRQNYNRRTLQSASTIRTVLSRKFKTSGVDYLFSNLLIIYKENTNEIND